MFATLDRNDADHRPVVGCLRSDPGPYVIPAGILAEVGYLVERRLGLRVLDAVLADIESGAYALDCGEDDLARIRDLLVRYGDLPLGFADAAVIACAERCGGRVLTLDQRDFGVVAGEGTIELLPAGHWS